MGSNAIIRRLDYSYKWRMIVFDTGYHELEEGGGFEPPILAYNGFQDRRIQPLSHPSLKPHILLIGIYICQVFH